ASVIFMHGLGQSNSTWKTLFEKSLALNLPHIRWLLPQANFHPVSYNDGELRPCWYDVHHLPPAADEFNEYAHLFLESLDTINSLVRTQVEGGIDTSKVILMGYSQGASMVAMASLNSSHRLAGVVALSGSIPPRFSETHSTVNTDVQDTPVLWCHGEADEKIPLQMGLDAIEYLKSVGFEVESKTYTSMVHEVNDEELKDILKWL
ncbi:Phospholipase/carboxylesterase/thioesterase, partial [Flagelloscypha sp. PMI_526]